MWNETLIESMGSHENGKRWLTVQLAAIVHAAIVGVLVAGSFWYVEQMSLPAHDRKIADVFFEKDPGGPPPQKGVPRPKNSEAKQVVKQAAPPTQISQNQIEPETINKNSNEELTDLFAGESEGDPEGVQGGDPNSNSKGGFGGSGGDGTAALQGEDAIYRPNNKPDLILPMIITQIKPDYPEPLRRIRREGIVVLEAVITRTGSVQNLRLLQSAHPLFDQEAMNAVMQWKYRPATLNGKPVAVYFTVTVSFKLR
jgi:protein TonB